MISAAKGCGGRGVGYSSMKSKWTKTIAERIRRAGVPRLARIRCEFLWFSVNKRHDPDNIEAGQKFVWDALKEAGVLKNDGWNQNAGSFHQHRLWKSPGVWILIEEATVQP